VQARKKVDVLISGNGPAALAVAWEAMCLGLAVLMISHREDAYLRVQRIHLAVVYRKYLLRMLSKNSILNQADDKFISELILNMTLTIKDIERYMRRRLEELNQENQLIEFLYHSRLDVVNCEQGIATVINLVDSDLELIEVEYEFLIGADGASHHAANVFNQCATKETISYISVKSPGHRYHGNFYITIKRQDGGILNIPDESHMMGIQSLVYGDQPLDVLYYLMFNPSSHHRSQMKSVKCNFISELPRPLYKLIKSHNIIAESVMLMYLKKIISNLFKDKELNNGELIISIVKPSQKHGVQKDKLKFVAFKTGMLEANKAAVKEGNTYFVVLGDAFRTPEYHVGHGLNDALWQASNINDIFSNKGSDSSLNYFSLLCKRSLDPYRDAIEVLIHNKQGFLKIVKINAAEQKKFLRKAELITFFAKQREKEQVPTQQPANEIRNHYL